jgi:hypothetical protein
MLVGMGLRHRDFLGFFLLLSIWWDVMEEWHDGQ